MRFLPALPALLTLVFLLSACGGRGSSPLTPMPTAAISPPDSALTPVMKTFIAAQNAPPNSEYDFERVDLNHDGRRDAIVLFKLPHYFWCGWDGCGLLILRATDETFVPVTIVNNVRGPIYVAQSKNHDWRDIIIRISGANISDKNIVLKYDGTSYPVSPMLAPDYPVPVDHLTHQRLFF